MDCLPRGSVQGLAEVTDANEIDKNEARRLFPAFH